MANTPKYEFINPLINSVDSRLDSSTITQKVEQSDVVDLIRQLIIVQLKQSELLQEIINQLGAAQRQRNQELAQWKKNNPVLSRSCKIAAHRLEKIQTEFLAGLASEVDNSFEDLQDSEYLLNEFFDKYGPRIVHLNTLLQTLAILGNAPDLPHSTSEA